MRAGQACIDYLNKTVWATLRKSPIQGVGVFAIRDIPEGIQITDNIAYDTSSDIYTTLNVLTEEELEKVHPEIRTLILDRTIFTAESPFLSFLSPNADAILQSWMNHSDRPNTTGQHTNRHVKKGEELTENFIRLAEGPIHPISSAHFTFLKGNGTRKLAVNSKHSTRRMREKREKESYLYLLGYGGLGDIISELVMCTEYAKKHGRSILFETYTYSSIDFKDVFDFSKYPVPIYTNTAKIQKLLRNNTLEPPINMNKYNVKGLTNVVGDKPAKKGTPNSSYLAFDLERDYPKDTILVRACGGGTEDKNEIAFFKNVRLRAGIVKEYRAAVRKFKIPDIYAAAHLRATDKQLSYTQHISGLDKSHSNTIRKGGVDGFIEEMEPIPTYIASDNKHLIKKLSKKYPFILHGDAAFKPVENGVNYTQKGLHRAGRHNKHILIDAIIDLLIMAKSKILMPSVGGFSEIAVQLWNDKKVVRHLLRED
jgi:hypothetical protein